MRKTGRKLLYDVARAAMRTIERLLGRIAMWTLRWLERRRDKRMGYVREEGDNRG